MTGSRYPLISFDWASRRCAFHFATRESTEYDMSAPVNSSSAKENFGCAFSSSESPPSFFTLMIWEGDRVRHLVFSSCFLCLWQSQSILSHHTVEHFPLWLVCGSMISSYRLNCVAASLSPFGSLPGSCFSTSTGAS